MTSVKCGMGAGPCQGIDSEHRPMPPYHQIAALFTPVTIITSSSALGTRSGYHNATFRQLPWTVSGGDQCISVGAHKAPKVLVNEKSRLRTGLCSSIQAETPYPIDIYSREICTLISTTTRSQCSVSTRTEHRTLTAIPGVPPPA